MALALGVEKLKDTGYGGVISIFVKRIMNNMPPIIYGDGSQTRDYTYVTDVVDAFDMILKHTKPLDTPVNLGTGREVKIIDLASKLIEMLGQSGRIKPVFVEPRPGEVQRLLADNSKVKKSVGWSPKYSLEDGLAGLIDWYKNYRSEEWSKPG